MVGAMRLIALTLLLLSVASPMWAADPTRPPDAWLQPSDPAGGEAGGEGLRLQSVLIPQRGRPVAVIGGHAVALGERVGDARLVKLNEHEAVLEGPDGVTQLYLTPQVEKRMIVPPKSRQAKQPGQAKDLP